MGREGSRRALHPVGQVRATQRPQGIRHSASTRMLFSRLSTLKSFPGLPLARRLREGRDLTSVSAAAPGAQHRVGAAQKHGGAAEAPDVFSKHLPLEAPSAGGPHAPQLTVLCVTCAVRFKSHLCWSAGPPTSPGTAPFGWWLPKAPSQSGNRASGSSPPSTSLGTAGHCQ